MEPAPPASKSVIVWSEPIVTSNPVPTPAAVDVTLPKLLTEPTSNVPDCKVSGCNNDSVKDQFVALEFIEYWPESKVTALVVELTLKPPNWSPVLVVPTFVPDAL